MTRDPHANNEGNTSSAREPESWTSQLRRGVLELCILALIAREPSYGYEIVTSLAGLGPLAAGENTVYPLLRRLKTDRLVETFARESPAGPPRQYYQLTPAGRVKLDALSAEWTEVAAAVDRCLTKGALS